MKRFALIWLVLGALLFIPTGAFAKDKHHKHYDRHDRHDHHDRHDWSRDQYQYRYRGDDRDYWENQQQIERDRLNNGYNRDGSPRYQYYPRYYYRR